MKNKGGKIGRYYLGFAKQKYTMCVFKSAKNLKNLNSLFKKLQFPKETAGMKNPYKNKLFKFGKKSEFISLNTCPIEVLLQENYKHFEKILNGVALKGHSIRPENFKQSRPKKLMKSNKSIPRKIF